METGDAATFSYEELVKERATLTARIEFLEKDNRDLFRQLQLWKQRVFGPKSEKRPLEPSSQFVFDFLKQDVTPPTLPEEEKRIEVSAHTKAARRKRDLSKLPTKEILHEPDTTACSCCGNEMAEIGRDISKELEYQPAKLFVNEHIRPRYACSRCKEGVAQAELPDTVKPLDRSIAGAGLLSHILVGKYEDHLPLHRQEKIFARLGIDIPRKNLCDWVGGVVEGYLDRLWGVQKEELLNLSYLQGDETTLKVQDNKTSGKCHTGYLWGMYSPERRIVLFEYAPTRAGDAAKDVFKGFKGTLQTDAYAGYNPVLLPDTVNRIACLAHVRRKFIEAGKSCEPETNAVLMLIAELYKQEKGWASLSPPERQQKREKDAIPILEKLKKYLEDLSTRTLPKAPLMEAISYTLKQWEAIVRIFSDERFHLDNNPIEREMRPIALGRKNYLFAGSHDGARRAAVIYSLFGTCRQHKVNPDEWLKFILTHMRSHPVPRLHELLPHNWKNSHLS